jgi:phage shock protein PspC (stress-responsive transcriptional regulator)
MQRRSRLARRPQDGMIAGVAAGIARAYDIDPTLVRVGMVVAAIVLPITPLVVVGYLVAAVVMPREDDAPGLDSVRHGVDDLVERGKSFYSETRRVIDRRSDTNLRATSTEPGSTEPAPPPSMSSMMPPPPPPPPGGTL